MECPFLGGLQFYLYVGPLGAQHPYTIPTVLHHPTGPGTAALITTLLEWKSPEF